MAGLAFVVLFVVGIAVQGSLPNPTATAAKVTSFYTGHHSRVLVASLLLTIGLLALIALAAVLAGELRAAGQHAAAGVLLASITGGAAVTVVSLAVQIGLDQAAVHSTDPGFMHGGYLLYSYAGAVPYLFVVLAAWAVALGGSGIFTSWFVASSSSSRRRCALSQMSRPHSSEIVSSRFSMAPRRS
jgi:hypothetical protein